MLKALGAIVLVAAVWALAVFHSPVTAIVALAGAVAVNQLTMEKNIAAIQRALEMHSKKIFPNLWRDE